MNRPESDRRVCEQCGALLTRHLRDGLCSRCIARFSLLDAEEGEGGPVTDNQSSVVSSEGEHVGGERSKLEGQESGGRGERPQEVPHPPFKVRFGDYELLEEIAHGGMGVVYRARQVSLNRTVAVKMLLFGQFAGKTAFERFRAEAQTAAQLQHPNIVAIHEIGETDGQPYFSMDYVAGRNLADLVRDRPMAAPHAAVYVRKIALAVQYAHTQGVLHRDLKPANVLIDEADEPRVTDFGLARRLVGDSELTLTGQVVGSPNFMPPEQGAGKKARLGPASDVYGLGALLYCLLTARPPFVAETFEATLEQVLHTEPVAPRQLNPGLPLDLETICLKCLEKDPARRYASAAELADELDRFLKGDPIHARPIGSVGKLWRWCRRKPAVARMAGGSLVAVLVVSAIAAWRVGRAREQQRRETYYAAVALADKFIQEGGTDRAMDLLLQCPEEFRHWEWGYLVAQCHQELLSIDSHTNRIPDHVYSYIGNVAFDITGRFLITHGFDRRIKIWSALTGREVAQLQTTNLSGTSWALHPSGPFLAVGTSNGLVRCLDLEARREFAVLSRAGTSETAATDAAIEIGEVTSMAYAPDGTALAAATASGTVTVWEVGAGRERWTTSFPVRSPEVRFTTNGNRLVVKGHLGAWWLSPTTGSVLKSEQLDSLRYWEMFVSPDGDSVVTFGTEGEVELRVAGGAPRRLGTSSGDQVSSSRRVFFSRDGRLFCTGGDRGTARVFRMPSGEEMLSLPERVHFANFSPGGRRLVVLTADRRVQVWDLERRAKAMTLRGHLMLVECAEFAPDGGRIATADQNGVVKIWPGSPGRAAWANGPWPHCFRTSPDGRFVVGNCVVGRMKIWDPDSGRLVRTLRARFDKPVQSDLSPDGKSIVTAALDPIARVWDLASGSLAGTYQGHTNGLCCVRFSHDGRFLATSDTVGIVKLWDVASRSQRLSLETGMLRVWGIEFNKPCDRAVVTSWGCRAFVWNLNSGQVERWLPGPAAALGSFFAPDGQTLVVFAMDGSIRVYDTVSWKVKTILKSRGRGTSGLDFTPDSRRMAVPSADHASFGFDAGVLQIWDAEHWREIVAIRSEVDQFGEARFIKPDGLRLVVPNSDGMVYQFEAFPWRAREYAGLPGATFGERIRAYATDYWRRRLAKEQEAVGLGSAEDDAGPWIDDLCSIPRASRCEARQIDLSLHYNLRLDANLDLYHNPADVDLTLAQFPTGSIDLLGVRFDARGVVLARAFDPIGGVIAQERWAPFPVRVEGIHVDQQARRLHVLHGVCLGLAQNFKEGTMVGSYVWHFEDGTIHEEPIVYGRDLRDWLIPDTEPPAELGRGRIGWIGDSPFAKKSAARMRVYLTTYANPRPDLKVSHIDFVSSMTQAAPFLIAMTVEP